MVASPRTFVPPFCPNASCVFHFFPTAWRFKKAGSYQRLAAPRTVQRYRCLTCSRNFSFQTFQTTYWLKKPHPSNPRSCASSPAPDSARSRVSSAVPTPRAPCLSKGGSPRGHEEDPPLRDVLEGSADAAESPLSGESHRPAAPTRRCEPQTGDDRVLQKTAGRRRAARDLPSVAQLHQALLGKEARRDAGAAHRRDVADAHGRRSAGRAALPVTRSLAEPAGGLLPTRNAHEDDPSIPEAPMRLR